MNEKTKSTVGLLLAIIAIVISFTVPEVRVLLGLDEKIEVETKEKPIEEYDKPIEKQETILKEKPVLSVDEKEKIEKNEPKIELEEEDKKQALRKFKIIDTESGQRDYKFENFFKAIVYELGFNQVTLEGIKSVEISSNKTVSDQLRATLEINVSINSEPLILPIMYGRGDTEKEAINHALSMNKEIIINKIKLLK